MSFDLYVFDMDPVPDDEESLADLLQDESGWDAPLTPALAAYVAEMAARYPDLDDDPDGSPWATWPLTQSSVGGKCCAFNVVWSAADSVAPELVAAALAKGLTVYDPQAGSVTRPDAARPSPGGRWRRWLGRR